MSPTTAAHKHPLFRWIASQLEPVTRFGVLTNTCSERQVFDDIPGRLVSESKVNGSLSGKGRALAVMCMTLAFFGLSSLCQARHTDPADTIASEGESAEHTVSGTELLQKMDKPAKTLLSLPKWISLSGQYRGRFEDDGALKFVPGANELYYLQRVRLMMTIKPSSWLRLSAELQDSRNYFYGNRPLAAYTSDPIDLRQAFVEIGNQEGTGFLARVGRQEIALGGSRMIGSGEWLNTGHSHDIVRLGYTDANSGITVDGIGGSEVLINPNGFDQHIPGEHWYGLYTTAKKWLPGASIEPYYLVKTDTKLKGERGLGSGAVSANGIRVNGKAPHGFDYSAEMVKEWGHFAQDKVDAFGAAYVLGWQVTSANWKPRVSAEYDYASGDRNAKDGVHGTFDNFYTGHGYYGFADQVGWRNIRSTRVGFDCAALKNLKLRFDGLDDSLASTQDGLYNVGGTLLAIDRKTTSSHVGREVDAVVEYKLSAMTSVKAGFSHIFPGTFLKQATPGSTYSSTYMMWTKAF